MAGQLPPDVLEDLMLFEAIDGPGGVAPGAMPGGFGDMQAEMDAEDAEDADADADANVVNVNFVPAPLPGAARPRVELGQGVGDEEDDEDTDEGEEEEEEYISVRMLTLFYERRLLTRFFFLL
jgi:hypothetical protein